MGQSFRELCNRHKRLLLPAPRPCIMEGLSRVNIRVNKNLFSGLLFLYLLIHSMLFGFIVCLVAAFFLFAPLFFPKYKYESDFFI